MGRIASGGWHPGFLRRNAVFVYEGSRAVAREKFSHRIDRIHHQVSLLFDQWIDRVRERTMGLPEWRQCARSPPFANGLCENSQAFLDFRCECGELRNRRRDAALDA